MVLENWYQLMASVSGGDILDRGKECKDLSEFDKGQIMRARHFTTSSQHHQSS